MWTTPATELKGTALRPEPDSELTQLNRRFRPALMSFFLRRLRNRADAEDLTQEVFIRLARSEAEVDAAAPYIFQVAANLLRDRARSEKVRTDYRLGLGALDQDRVETIDPLRILAGREKLAQFEKGLRELPERTRTIFLLFRIENMSRPEIAATYGLSVSSVEKHLARAMRHLTHKLEADE